MSVSFACYKGNWATQFAPIEALMERYRRKIGVPQAVWDNWKKDRCEFANLVEALPDNYRVRFQEHAAKILIKQLSRNKVALEFLP